MWKAKLLASLNRQENRTEKDKLPHRINSFIRPNNAN